MRRALIAATLLLAASTAHANPVDSFGFGARAPAMANAVAASSDDASANYYNPAGLVRGSDLRLDVAYRAAVPHLKINGRDLGLDDSRGLAVGIAAPGRIGPVRFAFGVSLWLPDQRLTRVRSISFDQPRFVYYDNRQQRLVLSANLAVQIVRGLYVGAGFTFMSRTTGTVYLKGNIAVGNPDESALVTFYRDADGDMYGVASAPTMMGCTAPAGYALMPGDCDDSRSSVRPRPSQRSPDGAPAGRHPGRWHLAVTGLPARGGRFLFARPLGGVEPRNRGQRCYEK